MSRAPATARATAEAAADRDLDVRLTRAVSARTGRSGAARDETKRRRRLFCRLEQGAEIGPHVVGDHLVAGGRRMNTVRLIETRVGGDAVEKEGHERDLRAPRDRREHRLELLRELRAVVRRQAHARQQHTRARSRAGNASSAATPRPAVRLSPSATTTPALCAWAGPRLSSATYTRTSPRA